MKRQVQSAYEVDTMAPTHSLPIVDDVHMYILAVTWPLLLTGGMN